MKEISIRMLRVLAAVCVITLVSSCATVEPMNLQGNERIGLYVEVSDEINLGYMGFTVFGNESEELDAELDRGPYIVDQVMAAAAPSFEWIDRDLEIGYDTKKLRQTARDLGYDYVLFVSDGRVCLDINCNRVFTGSGVYGSYAVGRRFASNLEYEIFNLETDKAHYRRRMSAYFELPEADDESSEPAPVYDTELVPDALRCLDLDNLNIAMQDMNQVAALFEIEPQESIDTDVHSTFSERTNCFFGSTSEASGN